MSIRHLDLPQWAAVVDPCTHTPGMFIGWIDAGKALVWWDGFDGAEEEDPDEIDGAVETMSRRVITVEDGANVRYDPERQRVIQPDTPVLEWTGDTWAPVCAVDDVAMTAHNDDAELCCAVCGGTYREVMAIG